MQVVTVGNRRFLAGSVGAVEGGVKISDALEICGSSRGITRAEIGTYLQTQNLGNLTSQNVMGMAAYGVEELTAEEQIAFEHQTALFARAKQLALPQLVNSTYAGIANR